MLVNMPSPTMGLTVSLLALACIGCATTSHFDGSRFHKRATDYRVGALDSTWTVVKVRGNDLAFHRAGGGSIAVHATCRGYDDVPQQALLNHLLFGTTHRRYLLDEEVTLDGRGARHALVDAELDGVPVRLEVYGLTNDYCVLDLS